MLSNETSLSMTSYCDTNLGDDNGQHGSGGEDPLQRPLERRHGGRRGLHPPQHHHLKQQPQQHHQR